MSRELGKLGIEIHIATTDSDLDGRLKVPLRRLVDRDGALVYYFHSPVLPKYGVSWEFSRWLKGHIQDYDLLHIHGIFLHCLLTGVAHARRSKIPYVVRPMGQLAPWCMRQGRIRKLAYLLLMGRPYLNGAAAIHYTAQQEQDDVERQGIRAPGVVIPLAVDESEFSLPPYGTFRQEHPWINSRKIVLFLSRLDPVKGLELLVVSLKSLSGERDDFVLVVAGEGKKGYEGRIRGLVRSSGLWERAVFTGFIDGSSKRALLRDSDIFVLPSYGENFGMAIAEAMAAGLPVVVSKSVNIYREIIDSEAGIATACQATEVCAALKQLLDDDGLRRQMGENARNLVEERFRWKTVAPKLIGLYRSILEASS